MPRKFCPVSAILSVGLGVFLNGCGRKPSAPHSKVEATVSGVVTMNGKPLTEGEITFDPSNFVRKNETARAAPIGADGRYTIRTLVGRNSVQVAATQLFRASDTDPEAGGDQSRDDSSVGYRLLEFEVQARDNTFNIELSQAASQR